MAGEYKCTLDEATQKTAKEELNEDPRERMGAVETFRTWILDQKYLKCPTDTNFLLPFLRARKFSQLEARKQLTNFLRRRGKLPYMFQDYDPTDKCINEVLDEGAFLILPGRDNCGRKVFVIRPGKLDADLNTYTIHDVLRTHGIVLDSLYFLDEITQVNGTVTLLDFTNMSMKLERKITMKERKDFFQTWEKGYPARIKAFHLYNTGPLMDFLLGIVRLVMSEKMQKRVKQHGDNLENIYKDIPMEMLPDEYLPDDYDGPSAGPVKQIINNMKEHFNSPEVTSRIRYISSSQHGFDEALMPTDVPQESFRQLNIE